MNTGVAERRLELTSVLFSAPQLLRFDRARLRFGLAVSATELKIPCHVEPEVGQLLAQALRQLGLMVASRHRSLLSSDDQDRLMLSDEYLGLPEIPASIAPSSGGPETRALAELGPRLHPALTGGVLSAWLGSGGGGRSLVGLTLAVLKQGLDELSTSPRSTDALFLTSLLLSSTLRRADTFLSGLGFQPELERLVSGAVATGAFLALRLGAQRVAREAKLAPDAAARLEAPLSAHLLFDRLATAGAGCAVYGCELLSPVPGQETAAGRLREAGPSAATAAVRQALDADKETARRAEHAVATARLRELVLRGLEQTERLEGQASAAALLGELQFTPGRLSGLLADDKERKRVAKELAALATELPDSPRHALQTLGEAVRRYSPKEPAECVGLERAKARDAYALSATGWLCDGWLERALQPARMALAHRTGQEVEGGLSAEYEAGRLYLLSLRETPLLKSAVDAPVAHLFVDVKDFTRRTALLGQAPMADFLRREFYQPLLSSARRHFSGMTQLADKGGVSVNNLLGDALSLSGGIEALVALAVDFRHHLNAYAQRLSREVQGEAVQRTLAAIEADYAKKASVPGANGAQLAAQQAEAVAKARGENLEAGVFISFGPSPLVITIDDDVFGRQKVAIAEKINESARGTARSQGARATADAFLQAERARRQDYGLRLPWAVYIGKPLAISISSEVEAQVRASLAAQNPTEAMRALAAPAKQALQELLRAGAEGDIYNAGVALSEEALLAFQEAQGERRQFRQLTVDPRALHPSLHQRYAFGPEPLRLLAGFHPDGRCAELFRFAGHAHFKGFERAGGIPVWELLDEAGVGRLLAEHHGPTWRRAP